MVASGFVAFTGCVMLRSVLDSIGESALSATRSKERGARGRCWSLHRCLTLACITLFFVMLAWAVGLMFLSLHARPLFGISCLKIVSPNHHVSSRDVAQQVSDNIQGGFFSVNLGALHKLLVKNPWLDRVTFRRQWPGTLEITLTEQQPIAVWNGKTLINARDERFVPPVDTFPTSLPQLFAEDAMLPEVLEKYRHFSEQLAGCGLSITALHLSKYHSWWFTLSDNMTVMLGHDDVEQRLQKFMLLYKKVIANHQSAPSRVDLRYPNGAAVDWQH